LLTGHEGTFTHAILSGVISPEHCNFKPGYLCQIIQLGNFTKIEKFLILLITQLKDLKYSPWFEITHPGDNAQLKIAV